MPRCSAFTHHAAWQSYIHASWQSYKVDILREINSQNPTLLTYISIVLNKLKLGKRMRYDVMCMYVNKWGFVFITWSYCLKIKKIKQPLRAMEYGYTVLHGGMEYGAPIGLT